MSESPNVAAGASVGHVHLKVADLERSIAFYSGVLGFDVTLRWGASAAFLSADGYHHHIGLNTWDSRNGPQPARNATGLYHSAFVFPSRRALANAVKRVIDAGIPIDGVADHLVSEAVYLRDPDGNGVELYRDRPRDEWTWRDGSVVMENAPLDLAALLLEASA